MKTISSCLCVGLCLFALACGGEGDDDNSKGSGVVVTTAPIRVADISVEASILASDPRCDGSFDGSGSVEATWPAPPPNGKAAAVSTISKKNVDKVSFNYRPDAVRFGATKPDRKAITITDGTLTDVCQDGSFMVSASTVWDVTPARPAALDDSAVVTVNKVGFKIASPIAVDIRTAKDFEVEFTLSCCPGGAAENWDVEVISTTNVAGALGWTPAPPRLACPGPDVAFIGKGKKQDVGQMSTVQLRVQKMGGRRCGLGTAIVEGN